MKTKRYEDGGGVREGRNENIDDDTRARAMEAIRRRLAGEAESAAPRVARPAARPMVAAPAVARPAAPAPSAAMADRSVPDLAEIRGQAPYKAGMLERLERGMPGGSMAASLPALAGVGLPAAARGAGKILGGLASSARDGWRAGEATKAAKRSEARYPRQQREVDRMEAEGPVRTTPVARGKGVGRSERERTPEEELMQGEGGRYKRGGKVKAYAKGGSVSASRRADGIAQRGKTRGRVM